MSQVYIRCQFFLIHLFNYKHTLINMSSRPFTKEDFAKWNTTTSVFHLPKRLVGKGKIPQLRADFVKAIGAEKVLAVQILPNHKVRVQFKSPSFRVRYEINGLSFRGVTLTPFPAYEEVKSVFIVLLFKWRITIFLRH